jgi:hypothetical protein
MRNLITFTFHAPFYAEIAGGNVIHETHIVPAHENPKDWAVANLPRLFENGCKLVSIEIN